MKSNLDLDFDANLNENMFIASHTTTCRLSLVFSEMYARPLKKNCFGAHCCCLLYLLLVRITFFHRNVCFYFVVHRDFVSILYLLLRCYRKHADDELLRYYYYFFLSFFPSFLSSFCLFSMFLAIFM